MGGFDFKESQGHCPVCGGTLKNSKSVFCSGKCRTKSRSSVGDNKDLEVLMRQYKEGRWTSVDGWGKK